MTTAINCMTAFPLPIHYKTYQSILSVATCFLLVYDRQVDQKSTQMLKLFEDRGREIPYEIA